MVSLRKLLILYVGTLGVYQLYWFYKHWKQIKIASGQDLWPVMRSIFSIFTAHSLFRDIDGVARQNGHQPAWSPGNIATWFVVITLAGYAAERLGALVDPDGIVGAVVSLGSILAVVPLLQAQRVANLACGDPAGASNGRWTAINWVGLLFGGLFWFFVVASLLGVGQ